MKKIMSLVFSLIFISSCFTPVLAGQIDEVVAESKVKLGFNDLPALKKGAAFGGYVGLIPDDERIDAGPIKIDYLYKTSFKNFTPLHHKKNLRNRMFLYPKYFGSKKIAITKARTKLNYLKVIYI